MSSDFSISLDPRFASMSIPGQLLLALLCLVPFLLIAWLYRAELRIVPLRTAMVLLLLRLSVLATILGLVLLRPLAAYSAGDWKRATVLVALDRSASMDVTDPVRNPISVLRLAKSLQLARDIVSDRQIDSWIQSSAASLSDSDRQLLDQVRSRVDSMTRDQIARAILAKRGAGLLDAISSKFDVRFLGFSGFDSFLEPGQVDELPQKNSGDQVTDIRLPLAKAKESASAVVLLSDGQHTPAASPLELASDLSKQGVRVYPIPLGDGSGPPDVSIAAIRVPQAVFLGADVVVEAQIKVARLPARTLDIEMVRPGQPAQSQTIQHDGEDRTYTVRFDSRFEDVGPQSIKVLSRPQPEEKFLANNERSVTIQVADSSAKILLVDSEARWEYHYLASALARDRGMSVRQVLFAAPRLGGSNEEELSKSGLPGMALPPGPDGLSDFDAIVLGDVSPEQLPLADRQRLEQFVGERGGTLILIAGPRSMPSAFIKSDGEKSDPFVKLLPVESVQPVDAAEGFHLALSSSGRESEFLRMEPTLEESEKRWEKLPRHLWGMTGKAKPAATVLASPRLDGPPVNDRVAYERDRAIMVKHTYGMGRVLYIGIDSTWRWRYKAGDTYHHRFWGQLARWAVADRPLLVGNEFVRFGPRKASIEEGGELEVGIRLSEIAKPLAPSDSTSVRISRLRAGEADAVVANLPLSRIDGRPRDFDAKLRDLPAGDYAIELAIPELGDMTLGPPDAAGQRRPLRATFRVVTPENRELADLGPNRPLLEQIAAKSGGKIVEPADASTLLDLLNSESQSRTVRHEIKLWQSWPMLSLLIGLLTLEWLVRKWSALP